MYDEPSLVDHFAGLIDRMSYTPECGGVSYHSCFVRIEERARAAGCDMGEVIDGLEGAVQGLQWYDRIGSYVRWMAEMMR